LRLIPEVTPLLVSYDVPGGVVSVGNAIVIYMYMCVCDNVKTYLKMFQNFIYILTMTTTIPIIIIRISEAKNDY